MIRKKSESLLQTVFVTILVLKKNIIPQIGKRL